MDLARDQLRTLQAIIDLGSLDAAARSLHITPSAVSQRIKALESTIGRVVLSRTRPVSATPDGEHLVRLSRQIEALEYETRLALGEEDFPESLPPVVALGVNADSLSTWFLPALATVNERFRVQFRLHRDDQERTALLLEAGTVMAAVTADPSAVSGCSVEYIGTMQYTAHASRSFARRWFPDGATADEFQRAPIVDFDAHDVLQTRFLAQQGVERTAPHHNISASGEFCRAISLGLGWGMLLPSQLLTLDDALVQLPGAPITTPLYWQQWNLSSTLLDAVRESVFAAAHSAIDVV